MSTTEFPSKIHQLELVWWINEWHCSWPLEVNTCSSSVAGWRGDSAGGCRKRSQAVQWHKCTIRSHPPLLFPQTLNYLSAMWRASITSLAFSRSLRRLTVHTFFKSLGKIVNSLLVPTVSWYSLILLMIPFMIKSCPYPCKIKFQVMNILQA